jgi:hypothetical protein
MAERIVQHGKQELQRVLKPLIASGAVTVDTVCGQLKELQKIRRSSLNNQPEVADAIYNSLLLAAREMFPAGKRLQGFEQAKIFSHESGTGRA